MSTQRFRLKQAYYLDEVVHWLNEQPDGFSLVYFGSVPLSDGNVNWVAVIDVENKEVPSS